MSEMNEGPQLKMKSDIMRRRPSPFDLLHNPLLLVWITDICCDMTSQKHFHVDALIEPASASSQPTQCSITVKTEQLHLSGL